MVRLTDNDTLGRKECTMIYAYENHIPSRAEIVIGMAADAIRRWREETRRVPACDSGRLRCRSGSFSTINGSIQRPLASSVSH